MKDETSGSIIKEFLGLRSEMYSYITDNNKGDKKAKELRKTLRKILNMRTIKAFY